MEEILMEVAKPVVEVLVSRATEEINCIQNFKDELKKLQRKIKIIGNTVAHMTEVKDAAVEEWLRNVVGIIYDAEYLLDVLAYEKHRADVRKRRSKKPLTRKMRLIIFAPLRRAYFRSRMGSRIRSITGDFKDAVKEADNIAQLKQLVRSASASASSFLRDARQMNPNNDPLQQVRRHVDTSIFIGRDSDVRSVVGMLCNPPQDSHNLTPNRRLSVVAIVGLGGMGKTSLADQVYQHETVVTHFPRRMWIPDLKEFDIDEILNKMVKYLGKGNNEICSTEAAVRKLEEHLGGKRYLLVLDDVWNKIPELWNSLRNKLERIGGSEESMVLVTTRDDDVAKTMHASSVHHLSGLWDEFSWKLFQQIAFANLLNEEVSALQVASGRKIVEKCKGVPLAIKSVGGVLRGKTKPWEWTNIEKSELWDIPEDETGILPSLRLSYKFLSSLMLKKCFSLCALWPKGCPFEKYDLRDRWIALGFIQKSNDENMISMEDIADGYLNELLSISFLSVYRRNEVGEATHYYLHDLVHDLARSVSTNERRYLEAGKKVKNFLDIQHLTMFGNVEIPSEFQDKLLIERLRSIDAWKNLPRGLLRHVKYLRVLCLRESKLEELPEKIGKLKCLKFLDVSSNPIKGLPECIMELYNLQTMCLYKCKSLEFPTSRLGNLVNLRHLGLSFGFCPAEGVIQQLSQLHTLPPLQLSEAGFQISELRCLHNIKGKLEIKGLEVVKSKLDTEQAILSDKPRVEQLRLSWDNTDNCTNCEEVLDRLCPHTNLKLLSIKGYAGDKFPSWLTRMNVSRERNNGDAVTLCNLMKIELIDCGRCQQLPTLGHLGSLKVIEIRNMGKVKQIGPEFYWGADLDLLKNNETQASSRCSSSMEKSGSGVYFASLKELRLHYLGDLEEWCEAPGEGGFPSLEELVIEECPELKRMPHHFPSLKELTVNGIISSRPLLSIMTNKEGSFTGLKKLHIMMVGELRHISEELGEFTSLQMLSIWHCYKLRSLPENLSKLLSLEVLSIHWCPKLVSLPNLNGLSSLHSLIMFGIDGLRGVPEGLQSCNSLQSLQISCCRQVETLPDLAGLNRLWTLSMRGMTKMIREPPDWLYSLPCLRDLLIGNYLELKEFPDLSPLLNITSLQALTVFGWEPLQSLPEQLQHFTMLTSLQIYDFHNLEHLPDWLGRLSSLQHLDMNRCKKLRKLPSKDAMERLTNLFHLGIKQCPLLEGAIKINGPEHHKIAAARFHVQITNSTD